MGAIKKLVAVAAGATAAWAIAIKPRTSNKPDLTLFSTYDYANGGLHDFGHDKPEHSLQAYEAAMQHGYGVVMEVRLTRDGVPVVFSDHELWRMCSEKGSVEQTKWDKLRKVSLLGTDQKIPTLEEALKLIDGQVPVLIQLTQWRDNYGVLCERCAEVTDKYEGIFAVQSMDYRIVRWFAKHRPTVIRGQMIEKRPNAVSGAFDMLVGAMQERLLFNIYTQPDFVSCHLLDKGSLSLRFCKFLYHVPVVHWVAKTISEYEMSREEDAIVVFEDIEP